MKLHIKIYVHKNLIAINTYYVGFISMCNGITGAVGLPVLFTDCAKVIASGGASSYLWGY